MADLPSEPPKTFLHISLCHLMKSKCYKINQSFKKEKQFGKFCISLLANAGNLKDVFDICESLFKILLSTTSSSCENEKNILNEKAQHIENFKADSSSHKSSGFSDHVAVGDNNRTKLLPATEETYLQQSKRSIYFEKCRSIMQSVKTSCLPNSTKNNDHVDTNNLLHSPSFAQYVLNNWCGLIPLWTSLHLGDQGRHGTSPVYKMWSDKYSNYDCITTPPRTQGIIEFHQKSVKHISMNSERERLDEVVKNLYITKKSQLRQLEIAKCKTKTDVSQKEKKAKESLPSKIVSEKWSKRKRKQSGPGYFQKIKITKMSPKQLEDWEKLHPMGW